MNSHEPGRNPNTASSAVLPQKKHGGIRARITVEPQALFGCNGSFTTFRMVVMHAERRKLYAAGSVIGGQGPDASDNNYFSFMCHIYKSKVKHP